MVVGSLYDVKMNAVSLYLSTCRYVMQAKTETPSSWSDLYKYLPYLRQALGCCVCTKILHVPIGPTDSICQHHICEGCRGGKMRLRPSCSWCKDHSEYKENTQLRIIVQCYKQMCCFLASLNLASTLSDVENGDKNSLLKIITEGSEFPENYSYNANPLPMSALTFTPSKIDEAEPELNTVTENIEITPGKSRRTRKKSCSATTVASCKVQQHNQNTQTDTTPPLVGVSGHYYHHHDDDNLDPLNDTNIDEIRRKSAHLPYRDDTGQNAPRRTKSQVPHLSEHDYMKEGPLCYSVVMPNGDEPKLTIRRRPGASVSPPKRRLKIDGNTSSSSQSGAESSPTRGRKQKLKENKRNGCRCGTATPTPGKLTCCGQRCPCYTTYKACVDCICRGCHNPRKGIPLPVETSMVEEMEINVV